MGGLVERENRRPRTTKYATEGCADRPAHRTFRRKLWGVDTEDGS